MSRWLVLSDLQEPFSAEHALPFARAVAREFKIPLDKTNVARDGGVINVGDENDHFWGGMYPHGPDSPYTPMQEIKIATRKHQAWAEAFPHQLIAESNHGRRWARKASAGGIPSSFVRPYQLVHKMPKTWRFAKTHTIGTKHPFMLLHGMGYSSMYAYRHIPMDKGMSCVFGHLAASPGVAHMQPNPGKARWGMNVGCLIDPAAYAFKYGDDFKFGPGRFVGVVLDDGMTPLLIPYERFNG